MPRSPQREDFAAVMRHHRTAWRVERVGWTIVAVLLMASMFGMFGDGPLSRAGAGSGDFHVEYRRLLRSSAPAEFRFRTNGSAAQGGLIRLRISRSLIDRMEIESIVPQPLRQVAGPGYTEFAFPVMKGPGTIDIIVRYRSATFGRQHGQMSLVGSEMVSIDQFVFP
jgi:hypothetical protein